MYGKPDASTTANAGVWRSRTICRRQRHRKMMIIIIRRMDEREAAAPKRLLSVDEVLS